MVCLPHRGIIDSFHLSNRVFGSAANVTVAGEGLMTLGALHSTMNLGGSVLVVIGFLVSRRNSTYDTVKNIKISYSTVKQGWLAAHVKHFGYWSDLNS